MKYPPLFQLAVLLLLSLLSSGSSALRKPVDCSAVQERDRYQYHQSSGVNVIYPFGEKFGVEVTCDMKTDGGRWTVIQRRMDGTLNFYRPWHEYKTGFGEANGEYWLGLEYIHMVSSRSAHELLVEMEDFEGNNASARYSSFSVGSECDGYQLQVEGFTDGGAGDGLKCHSGMKFSTFDRDQDSISDKNCAKTYFGAFWYCNCYYANPNGAYLWGENSNKGIAWQSWKGNDYSLKAISMKIRPVKQN